MEIIYKFINLAVSSNTSQKQHRASYKEGKRDWHTIDTHSFLVSVERQKKRWKRVSEGIVAWSMPTRCTKLGRHPATHTHTHACVWHGDEVCSIVILCGKWVYLFIYIFSRYKFLRFELILSLISHKLLLLHMTNLNHYCIVNIERNVENGKGIGTN